MCLIFHHRPACQPIQRRLYLCLGYRGEIFGGLEGLLLIEPIEDVLGDIVLLRFNRDGDWTSRAAGHGCENG